MEFKDVYFKKSQGDVLLIQPNLLQKVKPEDIDPVQTNYWNLCERVGSLFGDLPIEPNWGLLSIASNLKKHGYTVLYLDFHLFDYVKVQKQNNFIDSADIEKILSKKKYSVIAISVMTICHDNAIEIAHICKKINPECKIIVGGIHFSFLPEEALKFDFIDAVLCGEGENSFVELMKAIKDGDMQKSINGLVYKEGDKIVSHPPKLIYDLDTLPIPAYELWPSDIPIIPRIYTARGCNGGCDYCVVNQFFYGKYRIRKVSKIFEELDYVVNTLGCKDILIGDLNLGAFKDNTTELCSLIIRNNLNIKWWCQTRAKDLDEELLEKMSQAGCVQIGIGIESADITILQNTSSEKENKRFTTKELCKLIKKYNMEVQGYFIIGLPGETMLSAIDTIKSIDFLTKEGYIDITHIAVLVPYPGTPVYEYTEKYDLKILSKDFSKYIMNCDYMNTGVPVVETRELSCYQIYSLWQLALSTAAKNFERRKSKTSPSMFKNVNHFWKEIEL